MSFTNLFIYLIIHSFAYFLTYPQHTFCLVKSNVFILRKIIGQILEWLLIEFYNILLIHVTTNFKDSELKLVSKELQLFGVIARLSWQIVVDLCYVKTDRKQMLLLNNRYKTISGPFFAISMFIFHKHEVQRVSLVYLTDLNPNLFKSYDKKCKYFHFP